MKQVIIFLTLLISMIANANSMFDSMTKEQLADYEITVTKKSTGKVVGKMSRAEYKVVKIDNQDLFTVDQVNTIVAEHVELAHRDHLNRLKLSGGVGPSGGLKKSVNGSTMSVETEQSALGSLTYDRMLNRRWSVGGQVITNGSYLLGVGYDF